MFENLLVGLNQDVEVSYCMVCKYVLKILKIILVSSMKLTVLSFEILENT